MGKISLKKTKISIQNIEKKRFWLGILMGFISAISISLVFNQTREVFRLFTGVSADLLILKNKELTFFNYFFASLSTTLGLAITIWIWMSNRNHARKTDRLYKQLARTNALFIFWLMLMMIARFGSILPVILFGVHGYESQLELYNDYWILFVLIPIVVFAQSWFSVRLVYRSGKWMFFSFLVCLIAAFAISKITNVDQEKLNNSYFKRYEKDYKYIDKEISKSKEKYGIEYDTNTIVILKKWYAKSSVEQVNSIKTAFTKGNKVSIDTIILQKIVIHNFKKGSCNCYGRNSLEKWHYALPKDIFNQIKRFKSNSNETKELFNILKEQIDLVNVPRIEWDEHQNYTETERRKSIGVEYAIPKVLISQLKEVRDSLIINKKYSELSEILPEIKTKNKKNSP
jgi:hypothetical protein